MNRSRARRGATRAYAITFATATAIALSPIPVGQFGGVASAQISTSFSRIDVAGNQRIEADSIRAIAGIPTGRTVSPAELNAALQALFDSGFFANVDLVPAAGRLTILVEENPSINAIAFEGNRALSDAILGDVVELRSRRPFSAAAAEADALRIVEAYRANGRFNAQVRPVIIDRPENRVDLVFEVTEGQVTEVQRISFVGNRTFSDYRLRRVIETGEAGAFSVLFSNDTYDAQRIEFDKELLREFYRDRGFVDFDVRSVTSELSRERDGFFVSFNISEGAQYRFGRVGVNTVVGGIDPEVYNREIDIRSGSVYNATNVSNIAERMSFAIAEDGFAFADVRPRLVRNDADRTIDVAFEIVPAPRVFVERIDIEGNRETLDRVIRREFQFVEGDPLNRRDIREAERNIRSLGIFDAVNVNVREGSAPDRAVIDVDVQEQATGSIQFGVGYATDSGASGSIRFSERNFLGRGQSVNADLTVSQDTRVLSFGFTEPSLLDRDVLGGFDVFYRERDRTESSFQQTNIGFRPRVAFPLSEDSRLQVRYNLSMDEIRDVEADASQLIVPSDDITSSIELTYTLDKRNSRIDPSAGFRLQLSQELAGLGGDSDFSKTSGSIKGYASAFDEDLILSAEIEGGVLTSNDGASRIIDRFSLGGDSLRGFERGGIGPRDAGDSLGGNTFAVARFEASFPIGLPDDYGIFGGVFYDIGSVWELDNVNGTDGIVDDGQIWRSAAGVSLFWTTPVGPLRFNWAWPIEKEDFDKTEDFRISIDTRF